MCFQWSIEERTGVFGAPAAHNLVKNLVKFCSRSRPWRNRFRAINSRNQFPAFEEGSQLAALPSNEVLSTTHPPPTDFESFFWPLKHYLALPCTEPNNKSRLNDLDRLSTSHFVAPKRTKLQYKVAPKAAPDLVLRPSGFGSRFPTNVRPKRRTHSAAFRVARFLADTVFAWA